MTLKRFLQPPQESGLGKQADDYIDGKADGVLRASQDDYNEKFDKVWGKRGDGLLGDIAEWYGERVANRSGLRQWLRDAGPIATTVVAILALLKAFHLL